MPTFETVLFDLDGTLIDSVELIVDSYRHVFETHRLGERTREEILAGIGTPLRSVFAQMTDDSTLVDSWIATYREYNLANHDARIVAYDGIVEMVKQVKAAGMRVGL